MTRRKEKDVVRYVYDPRDYRRHIRMQEQAASRRAERTLVLKQCVCFCVFFVALVWASGILR